MKILKYLTLIGLIAYSQSAFTMEAPKTIYTAAELKDMEDNEPDKAARYLKQVATYKKYLMDHELEDQLARFQKKLAAAKQSKSASSTQEMVNLPPLPTEQEQQAFYAKIKALRDAEYGDQYAVPWIPRAQYTYNAIQSLEAQLKKIREEEVSATAATKAALEKRKAEFKKIISEYARAGLAGYDNNHDANKRYKKEEESKDVNLFGKLLKDLTANANVSWFGYNIPKTDTYKPTDK